MAISSPAPRAAPPQAGPVDDGRPERGHRARERPSWPIAGRRLRRSGESSPVSSTTPTRSPSVSVRDSAPSRIPSTRTNSNGSLPGSALRTGCAGRSWPPSSAVSAPVPGRNGSTAGGSMSSTGSSASESSSPAGSPSDSWNGSSSSIRSGPGSCSAARRGNRATGSPSTPWPTPSVAASSTSRIDGPNSNSSSTPRRDGSVGSSGARSPPSRSSTIASDASRSVAGHALPILADLIGDADPDVQKSISWALRSLTMVDRPAVEQFLDEQATIAASTADGHRTWVIRDALPKIDPAKAADIRSRLEGIRRRSDAPATSRAADTASRFADLPLGTRFAEPPLT